jgi:hypothetical protein
MGFSLFPVPVLRLTNWALAGTLSNCRPGLQLHAFRYKSGAEKV